MTSIKVAVQMDEPEILDKNADSTLAIIEEALKKTLKFIPILLMTYL